VRSRPDPQLKAGGSGTMSTTYGGFTATFRRLSRPSTPANGDARDALQGNADREPRADRVGRFLGREPNDSEINVMCVIAFQREPDPGVMVEGFTGSALLRSAGDLPLRPRHNRYVKVLDMIRITIDPQRSTTNEGVIPTVVGRHVPPDGTSVRYAFRCYACWIGTRARPVSPAV